MTPGGRRRGGTDPTLPAHIDPQKLPVGIYWHGRGRGRWRARVMREGVWVMETVAGPNAKLSELVAIMEQAAGGPTHGTVAWMFTRFHASSDFKGLAKETRRGYEHHRKIIETYRTKSGALLGTLVASLLTPTNIQAVHERIVLEGHPSKANHVLRYWRRVYSWAIPHLGLKSNPARGVKAAKEKGRHGMPVVQAYTAVLAYAREAASRKAHTEGSGPPYLPALLEIAYLCRLRGIEVVALCDADELPAGVLCDRTKGSRSNVATWTPRLRAAWDEAAEVRKNTLRRTRRPVPLRPEDRPLFLSEDGYPLTRAGLTSAFSRLMTAAIKDGVIDAGDRFTLHGLKHRGITDSKDKASGGHRTAAMQQHYDHSVPLVEPSGEG